MFTFYPQPDTLYVYAFHIKDAANHHTIRSFSGLRITRVFGPFIVISLGIYPVASMPTLWNAQQTSRISLSPPQLFRIAGIGQPTRAGPLLTKLTLACKHIPLLGVWNFLVVLEIHHERLLAIARLYIEIICNVSDLKDCLY